MFETPITQANSSGTLQKAIQQFHILAMLEFKNRYCQSPGNLHNSFLSICSNTFFSERFYQLVICAAAKDMDNLTSCPTHTVFLLCVGMGSHGVVQLGKGPD